MHKDKRALVDGVLEADKDAVAGIGAALPDVDELEEVLPTVGIAVSCAASQISVCIADGNAH